MLVTGGSRGIGAATVALAVQQGWRVALCYRQDGSTAAAFEQQIKQHVQWRMQRAACAEPRQRRVIGGDHQQTTWGK